MGRAKGKAPPRKRLADPSGESRIQAALAFLADLPLDDINYSAAAAKFAVNVCTLRNRFIGKMKSRAAAHAKQRILTDIQEDIVLEWMCFHAEEGRPWGREKLKLKVKKLTGREPSNDWVKSFKARHQDVVKFCGTSGLDPKRCQAFNKTTIDDHFKKLGEAIKKYKYRITLNVDETGMQRGGGRKRTGKKYFVSRRSRAKYKKRDANLELVTIIECACSDGTMLDPGFIFQGKTYEEDWFKNYPHISVGLTQNGWTDDLQCLQWFQHSFIPQARAKALTPDEPILLTFDGHGSHLTGQLHQIALEHNIHLHMLPAHTSNKTQPLDVGVFGPLSRKWIARNEEIVEETGMGMQKHRFVDEYMAVRQEAITPEIIMAAFRKTGIWPFNPNVFTEEDFAPSRTTSIIAHMPPSYPVPATGTQQTESDSATELELPSSDPMEINVTQAGGAQCAVGSSGELLDASQITWYHDADDEVPMSSHGNHDAGVPVANNPPNNSAEPPAQTSHMASLTPQDTAIHMDEAPLSTPAILSAAAMPDFTRSHVDKRWSLAKQNEVLSADLRHLEALYLAELARRQALEVQCELARQENGTLRTQLHRRAEAAEGRKGKQLQTEAQFLMSDEALALFTQKRQDAEAREQAEQQKQAEKTRVEREATDRRARLAADSSVRFTGSLKSKRKVDLEDIAALLLIPLGGTVSDLVDSIKNTLIETAAHRKNDLRFAGLYNTYNFKLDAPATSLAMSLGSETATAASSDETENLPLPPVHGASPIPFSPAPHLERSPFTAATNAPLSRHSLSTSHSIPYPSYSPTMSSMAEAGPSSSNSFNQYGPPHYPSFP